MMNRKMQGSDEVLINLSS